MQEEKLLVLLQKKKNFFEAIFDLTQEEASLSLTDWVANLEQKKILLSCIEEIDQELLQFKESLQTLSQDTTDELENIRIIIRHILHLDTINHNKRKEELDPYVGGEI